MTVDETPDALASPAQDRAEEAFLADIEDAAGRLRMLPDLPLVPEVPFDPSWPSEEP